MSIAAAQYSKFREEVVAKDEAFTFYDNGYLMFDIHGKIVVPFWSSCSRLEKIKKTHPKYAAFELKRLSLDEFLKLLRTFEADGISIGVNWSGTRLTGFDVEVPDLVAGLNYWIARRKEAKE